MVIKVLIKNLLCFRYYLLVVLAFFTLDLYSQAWGEFAKKSFNLDFVHFSIELLCLNYYFKLSNLF
jgi:hypothetical protein